jgi:hypothetical protein
MHHRAPPILTMPQPSAVGFRRRGQKTYPAINDKKAENARTFWPKLSRLLLLDIIVCTDHSARLILKVVTEVTRNEYG